MNYSFKTKSNIELFMRPFTLEDMKYEEYINAFHDQEVTRFNSHGLFPYTKEKQAAFATELENISNSKIVWAIYIHVTDPRYTQRIEKVIGNCCLQSIDWINRSAEFAIVIWDKSMWGKGVCSAVLYKILDHAFSHLGLHRVWTGTAATNISMRKAIEKCGFENEGIFRDGMFLQGKFVDVYSYGILSEEYFYPKNKT